MEVNAMAVKAINFKLDEDRIFELKDVASIFNMTVTDVISEALSEYFLPVLYILEKNYDILLFFLPE